MMEWWGTLLISLGTTIVGALIGGYFTLLAGKRKQKHEDLKDRKAELQKEYELRPRLELKKFKDLDHGKVESKCDFECLLLNIKNIKRDGESLFFVYDNKALDLENLCCVEYEFTNTGKTEIDSICVISNQPQTTSIFELSERSFFIKNGLLCYDAWAKKRFIKPGETISIKICYLNDQVMISQISAVATIYMEDINENLWRQPLFCPTDEMDNSTRASRKDFNSYKDVRAAIDCFKDPSLW